MKIFLLTPIYATTTQGSGATPVVHYFAKEWVKQGHEVHVFNLIARYPRFFYSVAKKYQQRLNSFFNIAVPVNCPTDFEQVYDGVHVSGLTYRKMIPHSRISKIERTRVVNEILEKIDIVGLPDIMIGHWENPQLEILPLLKQKLHVTTSLVLHSNSFDLKTTFGSDYEYWLSQIDILGFRSPVALRAYEEKYGRLEKKFLASSGVSQNFLEAGASTHPSFCGSVSKFIYVGALLERKYPAEVLDALEKSYPEGDFEITYIGNGNCDSTINKTHNVFNNRGTVNLVGRIPREQVIEYLKQNQVFVMISSGEVFGLVYLEAMALGLITIGSKGEGIDGIIKHGENGFLCTPGDANELCEIISHIKKLSPSELERISNNAKKTAIDYSDFNVAKRYIDEINYQINK